MTESQFLLFNRAANREQPVVSSVASCSSRARRDRAGVDSLDQSAGHNRVHRRDVQSVLLRGTSAARCGLLHEWLLSRDPWTGQDSFSSYNA
jgi:hypothetical protein